MRIPALLSGLLSLLPSQILAASTECPTGWHRICLGTCFCSPVAQAELGDWFGALGDSAALSLQQWLEESRASALQRNPQPVPLHIRARLLPYFEPATLEQARYLIGSTDEFDPASSLLYNPDVNAVTLLDVIVFRDQEAAFSNTTLWAHELVHVEQYRQWGAAGFARRYSQDADSVEAPAYQLQMRVAADLRAASRSEPPPAQEQMQ